MNKNVLAAKATATGSNMLLPLVLSEYTNRTYWQRSLTLLFITLLWLGFGVFHEAKAQTNVYNIPLSSIVSEFAACGDGGPYSCTAGQQVGFNWVDVLPTTANVTSITVQVRFGVICSGGVANNMFLNGASNGTITPGSPTLGCNCNFSSNIPITTFSLNPANYIEGGTNQFRITIASSCLGFFPNWGATYAIVTVQAGPLCNLAVESNPLHTVASGCNNGTFRTGAGAWFDLPVSANTRYVFTWSNNGNSSINGFCATPLNGSGAAFTTNQTAWNSGTTTSLRVSAARNGNWIGTSGIMTYRRTTPSAVSVANAGAQCGGSRTITASGGANGTIYWQNTTSNGTSTATVSTSQTVSATGTYYFRSSNNGCWGTQGGATVTINPIPGTPTVSGGGTFCSSTTLVPSTVSGATVYWQGTTSNGTSTAATGNQIVSSNGTYYFRALTAAGCWGTQRATAVTILSQPTSPTTAPKSPNVAAVCAGASVGISSAATGGTDRGCTIEYRASTDGGVSWTATSTALPTGLSSSVAGTNRIQIQARRNSCATAGCNVTAWTTVATWNVDPIPGNPGVTAGSRCGTGNITLSASIGSNGNQVRWFNASSGGTQLSTSTSYTASYSATTTVWVETFNTTTGCVSGRVPVVATVNPIPSAAHTQTNVSCFGGNNGTIDLTPSGGTPGYTYAWSNGSNSQDLFNLTQGTFTVTVTDTRGCTVTRSATITQPSQAMTLTTSSNNSTCGQANGSATVNFTNPATSGGNAVSYAWSVVGSITNGTNTSTLSNVPAGSYSVTVTNAAGCTRVATINVVDAGAPTASITAQTNLLCFGNTNGSASVTIGGGTPPYNVVWSNGNTQNGVPAGTYSTSTGLSAGVISVQVTDANGCNAGANTTITQPAQLTASVAATSNVSCFGGNNGSINLSVAGGTGAKTFTWSGGASGQNPTGLAAGNYNVTVRDANNCQTTISNITISQPAAALSATLNTNTPVTCFGGNNGALNINVSGGTSPYSYNWSNNALTQDVSGLTAGSYTVTVTDAQNCTTTFSATVAQPSDLVASVASQVNVACKGGSTGSVTLSASGGTPGYTYSINGTNFQASAVFSGLAAGNYSFTVRDNNNCTKVVGATVSEPANALSVVVANTEPADCFGAANGSVNITASGGTPNYAFAWSNSAVTQNLAAVAAGNYTVTVTDNNGCTATTAAVVGQPAQLSATPTKVDVTVCVGNANGAINFTNPSGGLGTYSYSINGGSSFSTAPNFTGLVAGTYNLVIKDPAASGACEVSLGTITVNDAPSLPAPTFPGGNFYTSCGLVIVNAVPGAGTQQVKLYNGPVSPANLVDVGTSFVLRNIPAGTYTFNATSLNTITNCESVLSSSFTLEVISPLILNGTATNVSCFGLNDGAISLSATGANPPYNFAWSNGAVTQNLSGISGGTYTVTVTDQDGCFNIETVTIIENPPLAATVDVQELNGFSISTCLVPGSNVEVTASGGTVVTPQQSSYNFDWSDGGTGNVRNNLQPGVSTVTVSDQNGCSVVRTVNLIPVPDLTLNVVESFECASGGGFSSASITVFASGGIPPYTYSTDGVNFQTSNKITGISDGANVTVTVKDGPGCTESTNITVNFPPANVPVGDCDFIYVAPESQGGDPLNVGTPDCPTTLESAINLVDANRNYIRVLQGTYSFGTPLNLVSNVVIEGGYTKVNDIWVKQTASSTLNFDEAFLNPSFGVGHYVGFVSSGASNWTLKDVNINVQLSGAVGQQDEKGKSVYGILINNSSSNYKLTNVNIATGNASDGVAGVAGSNGANGNNGQSGRNGEFIVGAPATCCNGANGDGGNGANGVGAAGGTGEIAPNHLTNGGTNKNQPRGANDIRSSGAGGAGGHGGATIGTTPSPGRSSGVGGNGGFNGSTFNAIGANAATGSGTLVWDFYNQPVPGPIPGGNNGANGANGGNASVSYSPGTQPAAFQLQDFFIPGDGSDGGNGFGGAGGSGGGGSGSVIVNGTNGPVGSPSFVHVLRGSGGGSGGSGGEGGAGGIGGNGGGANFGLYVAANSTTGATFQAINITSLGAAGQGGAGGQGGVGGVGGQGGAGGALVRDDVNNVTLISPAGNGGNGGIAGNGGRGQDGDNGVAQPIYFGGSTPPTQSVAASNGSVTVAGLKGCTNSVITITKTSSNPWGLSGANFVNDISSSSTSFTTASNMADIFYTTTGWKNINVGATTLTDFVFIRQSRSLPVITSAPFNAICVGGTINLTTSAVGQQYLWEVALVSDPQNPLFTFASKDVNNLTLNTAGDYQIKLQVEDFCCGWSVPVYSTVTVNPLPATVATINGSSSFCIGETAVFSANFVANAAPNANSTTGYKWQLPPGATVLSAGGLDGVNGATANTITVQLGSSAGNVSITPSNACGNGAVTNKAITIKPSPTSVVFSSVNPICNGSSVQITAVANGGSGGFSYSWSTGANTNIINVSPTVTTTYSVTATASNGCTIASSHTINVTPIPVAPVLTSPTNVISVQFTANWNAVPNATSYFIDVATNSTFTNFVAGFNNLNVGNVLSTTVTGLQPNQTYFYRVRSATGSCISPNSAASSVVTGGHTWTANAINIADKTDWFNPNNWIPNVVPNSTIDALIPTNPLGGNFFPIINVGQNASAKNLTVNTNASVTINLGGELAVYGTTNYNGLDNMGTGDLMIRGGQVNGSFTIGTFAVDRSAGVSIGAGSNINITAKLALEVGIITTTGANVVLKSTPAQTAYVDDFNDGTGITNANTGVVGNLSIERYVPLAVNAVALPHLNRFHYLGALTGGTAAKWSGQFLFNPTAGLVDGTAVTPTSTCDPAFLHSSSAFSNLFTFNESKIKNDCFQNAWEARTTAAPTARGTGFAGRINDPSILIAPGRVLSETGAYANTGVNRTLSITSGPGKNTNAKGEHLVSNPFFAPIDWTKVTGTNLDNTAYKFDPHTGTFRPVNNISGNKIISTNEGFVVKPLDNTQSSYTLNLTPDMRVNSTNDQFLRQQQGFAYGLRIFVEANHEADEALIAFDGSFTDMFDNGFDASKLNSVLGVPSIYMRDADTARNGILAIAPNTAQLSIPLGVVIEFNGTHELRFEGMNDFPNTSIVWLEDLQTGTIQYLRQNNTYTFTGNKTDAADRFVLHFAPEMILGSTTADCNNENGSLFIQERGGLNWDYTLSDAQAQVIATGSLSDETLDFTALASGSYTFELVHTLSGYQTTEIINVQQVTTVAIQSNISSSEVEAGEVFTLDVTAMTGADSWTIDMGDGTIFTDETVIDHSYSIGGNYIITITAENANCSAVATIDVAVNDVVTSVIQHQETGNLEVNANGNELYITQKLKAGTVTTDVTIYNTLGQIVSTQVISAAFDQASTVRLEDVAKGTYIAVVTANGERVTRRIVVSE